MSEEIKKISLIEVEINKISIQPGDVLLAKLKGSDFEDHETCEALKKSLQSVFPKNRVGVLFMQGNEIDFTVISQQVAEALEKASKPEESSCNSTNYCDNCNCGKKKRSLEEVASKIMEENKGLFEDLAKLEEQEKLKEEENGPDSSQSS